MTAIDLATPRTISIEERGRKYLLTLLRIQKRQWLKYFEGIVSTSENQGGKRVDSFDSTSARVELVESALVDAKGYNTADGSPVTSTTGWQQLIPLRHRQAVGNALVDVEKAEPTDADAITLGVEPVYLNAVWGADADGVMRKFTGLCHRFKTPSAEQQRRFSRDSSRSMVIGGSRRGVTRWLGVQATLVDLYDELILSVDGYQVNGMQLDNIPMIVAEMDAYHKVAAAAVLFEPASADIEEEK
jgi:hypothetical protein